MHASFSQSLSCQRVSVYCHVCMIKVYLCKKLHMKKLSWLDLWIIGNWLHFTYFSICSSWWYIALLWHTGSYKHHTCSEQSGCLSRVFSSLHSHSISGLDFRVYFSTNPLDFTLNSLDHLSFWHMALQNHSSISTP